ncbi:MAG: hypothetical protein HY291_07995 [Planctomycetes bacterium]|nr:hypothetical protein [Planctomycetota bacterium]
MWWEHLLVGAIVLAAAAWGVWALAGTFRGKSTCGCGKDACPKKPGAPPDAT